MLRKVISVVAAAVMAFSVFTGTVFAEEAYITRGEACDMLISAADNYNPGVTREDIEKGEADEDKPVTRAEALVMLYRAFGDFPEIKGSNLRLALPKEGFEDIALLDDEELNNALDAGIAAGTGEGTFSPDEYITREQLQRFISRSYTVFGTNPKDDFYTAVNKEQLDTGEIPDGEEITGNLYKLMTDTDLQVNELIKEISANSTEPGSAEDKIKILYNNIMNKEERNKLNYSPVMPYIEKLEECSTIADLDDLNELLYNDLGLSFWKFGLSLDSMDSSSYIVAFSSASPSLEKEVYEGKDKNSELAFKHYIQSLLMLCGESSEQAEKDTDDLYELEKKLSENSLDLADEYNLELTYNMYTLDELNGIFENVDLERIFKASGYKSRDKILVSDKGLMECFAKMLTDENIDSIKNYFKINILDSFSGTYGEEFKKIDDTYQQERYGIQGSTTDEYKATQAVINLMPEYVGEAYGNKYNNEKTNEEVKNIIDLVIGVYKDRISNLDWMSEQTKAKAKNKLDAMQIKVGMPNKWDNILADAEIKSFEDGGSYFQNVVEIRKANDRYNASLDGTEVDKTQWAMYPNTVNACHVFQLNDITFPTAFLQFPAYSEDMSFEEKLGAVGSVIGHEITHAFDKSGAQFDEKGNGADWWTAEDKAKFEELCQNVVEFYSGEEYAPGIEVNPQLTLDENIADLGAMSCITEIASQYENFDYKKMYESYARMWCSIYTRETAVYRTQTDPHTIGALRANRSLQSVDKFYEVFDIQPGDGMWIEPEDRAKVW